MATMKQQLAVKKITETHMPVSQAMRAVGYTEITSQRPQNLTESKGFKELMGEVISKTKVIKVLNEGLEATKLEEGAERADYNVRHKYAETVLKVAGELRPDSFLGGNTLVVLNSEQQKRIAERVVMLPNNESVLQDEKPAALDAPSEQNMA